MEARQKAHELSDLSFTKCFRVTAFVEPWHVTVLMQNKIIATQEPGKIINVKENVNTMEYFI